MSAATASAAELTGDATGETVTTAFDELTREELKAAREAQVDQVEQTFLRALMERCEGNVSRAARESGIHRSYLQKLLARHREALGDLARSVED